MGSNLSHYLLFSLSLIAAIAMIVEGSLILFLKKQITPFPSKILFGLGVLLMGNEKSRQRFSGRTSPRDLRSYGAYTLVFGAIILLSSFVYLFTVIF